MSASAVTGLLRRAGEWLVEPEDGVDSELLTVPRPDDAGGLAPEIAVPPRRYPLLAVVGLARGCGATTIARALGTELASRERGAAVVASAGVPAVVALGESQAAARLAAALTGLPRVRLAGSLCLTAHDDPATLASATRAAAPAVIEVEPGAAAVEAAPVVDRVVLISPPSLDSRLVAAVAETVGEVARDPLVVVNRCADHDAWPGTADAFVPDSRLGARLALAGRDPRGWLGKAIRQLADLCLGP